MWFLKVKKKVKLSPFFFFAFCFCELAFLRFLSLFAAFCACARKWPRIFSFLRFLCSFLLPPPWTQFCFCFCPFFTFSGQLVWKWPQFLVFCQRFFGFVFILFLLLCVFVRFRRRASDLFLRPFVHPDGPRDLATHRSWEHGRAFQDHHGALRRQRQPADSYRLACCVSG